MTRQGLDEIPQLGPPRKIVGLIGLDCKNVRPSGFQTNVLPVVNVNVSASGRQDRDLPLVPTGSPTIVTVLRGNTPLNCWRLPRSLGSSLTGKTNNMKLNSALSYLCKLCKEIDD